VGISLQRVSDSSGDEEQPRLKIPGGDKVATSIASLLLRGRDKQQSKGGFSELQAAKRRM